MFTNVDVHLMLGWTPKLVTLVLKESKQSETLSQFLLFIQLNTNSQSVSLSGTSDSSKIKKLNELVLLGDLIIFSYIFEI